VAIYIGLAIGLIIGGLVICLLSGNAKQPFLITLFWWIGIIVAVVGLLLAIAPIVAWLAGTAKQAIGA
jgi:hypothetical protein